MHRVISDIILIIMSPKMYLNIISININTTRSKEKYVGAIVLS